MNEPRLQRHIEQHPYPLLFATISGAHLYGFPSPDSDVDLRGSHLLPLREVLGLLRADETREISGIHAGIEVDLVSHDAGKYLGLLTKNNGYILEQVFSPLVVMGEEFLAELRPLTRRCITRHHYHHYPPRLLRHAANAAGKRGAEEGQVTALRLPRPPDRHPPAPHRRGRGESDSPQRAFPAAVDSGPDRQQNGRENRPGLARLAIPRLAAG